MVAVDDLLIECSQVLLTLRSNLLHMPNKMSNQTNARHSDTIFSIGDWVFLRLQLYRQSSSKMLSRTTKLSRHFFGPFQITERIGAMAYLLSLFHVSNLNLCLGDHTSRQAPLPDSFIDHHLILYPRHVLSSWTILHQGHQI